MANISNIPMAQCEMIINVLRAHLMKFDAKKLSFDVNKNISFETPNGTVTIDQNGSAKYI